MGYNYLIKQKTLWEKKKLLVTSNFFFSMDVFKSCLLLMRQNKYLWSKGLTINQCRAALMKNNILYWSEYHEKNCKVQNQDQIACSAVRS